MRSIVRVGLLCVAFTHAAASAAEPKDAKDLVVCPFTSDEVHAAIGMRMKWQPPDLNEFNGMHHANCRGMGDGNNGYMTITQSLAPAANAAKRFDAIIRTELKGAEPVAGDPDGARWLERPDMKIYVLAYVRGRVLTVIRIMSPDRELIAGLKPGLLKLKRVP